MECSNGAVKTAFDIQVDGKRRPGRLLHLQKQLTFFQKNTCELDIVLTRTVNILAPNKLIKLRML